MDYKALFVESIGKFSNNPIWIDAQFSGIKTISNTHVGSVGQDFMENICRDLGYVVEVPQGKLPGHEARSPWDIKINGITFELKTATEDISGNYQFNHFRYHREYDAVICLGVSPDDLYIRFWSKADLVTGKAGHLVSMEKSGNASYKLTKKQKDLYPFNQFQQRLDEFINSFRL